MAEIYRFRQQDPIALPSSIEQEQALLGSALANGTVLQRCPWLRPEDFFEPVHGRIWAALRTAFDSGRRADYLALAPLFEQDGALADIDRGKYLARMAGLAAPIDEAIEEKAFLMSRPATE